MTTETTTTEVEITDWDDFQDGDTVVRQPTADGWGAFIVRREVPVQPTPGPGTFGTATVEGEASRRGFIYEDAFSRTYFTYPLDGMQCETDEFADFVPDGTEEFERGKEAAFAAAQDVPVFGSPSQAYMDNSQNGMWDSRALGAARTAIVEAARASFNNEENK